MLLGFPLIASGQNIAGKVINCIDYQPLAGVSVRIEGTNTGTATGSDGQYTLAGIGTGVCELEFSFIRKKTVREKVTVSGAGTHTLNVCMEEDITTISEVTVTATTGARKIREIVESPMAVSVIDGTKLRGLTSGIEDVLKRTSGLTVRQTGGLGSESRISVHGLEGKRVAVFIDGFALNSPDGSFDINDMPVDVIERIEVYKGIVPAEYGGDGLGGAINIETREVDCDVIGATLEAGSFGTYRAMIGVKKKFDEPGIQLEFAMLHNQSDNNYTMDLTSFDPASPYSQVRRNNDFYRSSIVVPGIIFTKLWFDKIEMEFAFYSNKKELQNIFFDSRSAYTYGSNIMPSLTLEKENFLAEGLDFKLSVVTPMVRQHLVDTVSSVYQWNGEKSFSYGETDDKQFNLSDDKHFEFRSKLNLKYRLAESHRLNLNNQFVFANRRPKDDYLIDWLGYDPSGFPSRMHSNVTGLAYEFTSPDRRWENIAALKAYWLQTEIYRTEEIGVTSDFKQTPGVTSSNNLYWGWLEGASYRLLEGFRLKASYEHAVRLPDNEELFGNGITVKSAVNLLPERSDNFSLGVILDRRDFLRLTRLQLEANTFWMNTRDLISLQPADHRYAYQNMDDTRIKGFDADLKVDFIPELYGYFNITYQDLRNTRRWLTDDQKTSNPKYGRQVPNIPPFYYNAGLEFHRADFLMKGELFRIFADWSYVGEFNYAWKMSDRKDQEYLWMIPACRNLSTGVQQSFFNNQLSLCVEVRNILDTPQFNNLKMPLPGRTFNIKLRYNWFRDKSEGGAMAF
jgi:outer membrane cobalamin receptor